MKNDISRFIKAQAEVYETALAEIKNGRKNSHWIWYIFPQLADLGYSETAKYYGIKDMAEAKAYLANESLRQRLVEISSELLSLPTNDALEVMGSPDHLKLRSSMTLFALADPECEVFRSVLEKYYEGRMDDKTVALLNNNEQGK